MRHPNFRPLLETTCLSLLLLSAVDLKCNLKTKYQKQNVLLGQIGAGCTYKALVESSSTKNPITMIKKEFPWWGELHGWWHTNHAYNSTWSAADSGQKFTRHVVELFKLWPDPLGGDPSFSSAEDLMSVDVKMPLLMIQLLPPPFCSEQGSSSSAAPPLPHFRSSPLSAAPLPVLFFSESMFASPSPLPFFSQKPAPSPLPPVASEHLSLAPLLSPMPGSPAILSLHPSVFNKGNPINLNDNPPFPFVSPCPKLQPIHPSLEQDQALLKPSCHQSHPQFQQAQQERSEVKCHHLQYSYWKENGKANSHLAECQHQFTMQHEQYAHEEAMVAQELEKMKLTVKLEELWGQNLTLQRGVAGGEDQGPSLTNEDVHKLNNSL
ncbi:hypothetical protein F5J12DRAFT_784820 [Pisolithus orientalis]|uniref:uncharacterized protein n=1 Tax=Pisolithus orientalis TaxID=936130 RepID=UPI002225582D|nr:uncharacterized protein F5J12DRAFT_784820 [Pisolithus orientalis]KAI5998978.1 hypothetical protein F5J12DRAFT_784820 [Pisolithus orientalis]